MSSNKKIFLLIAAPLLVVFVGVVVWMFSSEKNTSNSASEPTAQEPTQTTKKASCEPFILQPPVDLNTVSAVLYPGQVRGGNYKAHGGFRFDTLKTNAVTVRAPYDAVATQGSRYIELGEIQYMFDFRTECGYEYRFDHLKTLSPEFQAIADQLPEAKPDDSRTTPINNSPSVQAGDIIATEVGFSRGPNVSVDFGLYDKRQPNAASKDATWAAKYEQFKEKVWYGVCWLDYFTSEQTTTLRALPAGDATQGKASDYCR